MAVDGLAVDASKLYPDVRTWWTYGKAPQLGRGASPRANSTPKSGACWVSELPFG